MKKSELKLYSAPIDPFSARVRLFLAEKNIEHELLVVDHDNPPAEFLKLNPGGETPLIVHQGKVLAESLVITEYLDEIYSELPLLPREAYDKAKVKVQIASTERLRLALLDLMYEENEELRKEAHSTVEKEIQFLSSEIGSKKFLSSDELGLADVDAAPFLYLFKLLDQRAPKNVSDWIDRVLARPSITQDSWMEDFGKHFQKVKNQANQ